MDARYYLAAIPLIVAVLVLSAASVAAGFAFRNRVLRAVFVGLGIITVPLYPLVYYRMIIHAPEEAAGASLFWLFIVALVVGTIVLAQLVLSGIGAGVYWWHRLDAMNRIDRGVRAVFVGIAASLALGVVAYLCTGTAIRMTIAIIE